MMMMMMRARSMNSFPGASPPGTPSSGTPPLSGCEEEDNPDGYDGSDAFDPSPIVTIV